MSLLDLVLVALWISATLLGLSINSLVLYEADFELLGLILEVIVIGVFLDELLADSSFFISAESHFLDIVVLHHFHLLLLLVSSESEPLGI